MVNAFNDLVASRSCRASFFTLLSIGGKEDGGKEDGGREDGGKEDGGKEEDRWKEVWREKNLVRIK